MTNDKAIKAAALADKLRKDAIELNDTSRRMSAFAVEFGDSEFAKHAQELAGAAMIALHWADAIEKRA